MIKVIYIEQQNIKKYHQVNKSTIGYSKVPPSTPKYHQLPKNTIRYPKVSSETQKFFQVPKSTTKYPKVSSGTQKYHKYHLQTDGQTDRLAWLKYWAP